MQAPFREIPNYTPRGGDSIVREDALYNLAHNPAETTNLAVRFPEKVNALRARLEAIKRAP